MAFWCGGLPDLIDARCASQLDRRFLDVRARSSQGTAPNLPGNSVRGRLAGDGVKVNTRNHVIATASSGDE
jgi:hypothetical protein